MPALNLTSTEIVDAAARMGQLMDALNDGGADAPAIEAELDRIMDALAESVPDRLDALAWVYARLDGEAALLRAEEKRIAVRRRASEAAADRVKSRASAVLVAWQTLGNEPKVKTLHRSFWLARSTRLEGPEDIEAWPPDWRRTKIEPDRAAAKTALEGGAEVAGFRLATEESVRWR